MMYYSCIRSIWLCRKESRRDCAWLHHLSCRHLATMALAKWLFCMVLVCFFTLAAQRPIFGCGGFVGFVGSNCGPNCRSDGNGGCRRSIGLEIGWAFGWGYSNLGISYGFGSGFGGGSGLGRAFLSLDQGVSIEFAWTLNAVPNLNWDSAAIFLIFSPFK